MHFTVDQSRTILLPAFCLHGGRCVRDNGQEVSQQERAVESEQRNER